MGTMSVSPPSTSALWSEGPAPPTRERPGPSGPTHRAPSDCSSVISATPPASSGERRSIGSDVVAMGWYLLVSGVRAVRSPAIRERGVGRAVDDEAQELGAGVVPDAVHHSLSLGDERHVEIGDDHAF